MCILKIFQCIFGNLKKYYETEIFTSLKSLNRKSFFIASLFSTLLHLFSKSGDNFVWRSSSFNFSTLKISIKSNNQYWVTLYIILITTVLQFHPYLSFKYNLDYYKKYRNVKNFINTVKKIIITIFLLKYRREVTCTTPL